MAKSSNEMDSESLFVSTTSLEVFRMEIQSMMTELGKPSGKQRFVVEQMMESLMESSDRWWESMERCLESH